MKTENERLRKELEAAHSQSNEADRTNDSKEVQDQLNEALAKMNAAQSSLEKSTADQELLQKELQKTKDQLASVQHEYELLKSSKVQSARSADSRQQARYTQRIAELE